MTTLVLDSDDGLSGVRQFRAIFKVRSIIFHHGGGMLRRELASPSESARAVHGKYLGQAARRRLTCCLFKALPAIFLLWLLTPAWAQISPGPLSRAHQWLSGATHCTACHKLGSVATLKCLDCHTEIATRLAAHKGLHATYNIPTGSSTECSRCHSEHNGEDFPLIKWDTKTFDHKLTGYVLEGKHAGVACARCHSAEHIAPAVRASIKIKNLGRSFLEIPQACVTCHEDQHKGRLGADCLQCHNYSDWKTLSVGKFDHAKTRFPLTGLHAQVKCEKCHTSGTDGKPRYTGIPFAKCSDCHADPHHGSFPQGCQSCHNTESWKRVSMAAVDRNFDHSKTKYPLQGKHAGVDCGRCHAGGDFKKPVAFAKCVDCHQLDPHKGQFAKRPSGAECASCHTVEGFKPSRFTAKDHSTSAYGLEGKHFAVECGKCHIPKGKDTLFKIKFQQCTDCHKDEHEGQFVAAPYVNHCERCHTLQGMKPSTFTLARHKESHFVLTGGHVAVPCDDCHKEQVYAEGTPKPVVFYHWRNLSCGTCHEDPHKGQFAKRMQEARPDGTAVGCEACHSTKTWKELSRFDHSKTLFPLVGAHKATSCIDCHKPPNMETKLIASDFTAAPTTCEDCHEDIHGKQFAKNGITACIDCHNSAKWKPSLFDHDKRTSFALQGLHKNVRCEGCHKEFRMVEGKKVLFYQPTPKQCEGCHVAGTVPAGKSEGVSEGHGTGRNWVRLPRLDGMLTPPIV